MSKDQKCNLSFGKHIQTVFVKRKLTKEQRQEKRFIKQQEKEFRALFGKAKAKLKKAAMTKAIRLELMEDLAKCNNVEIMHYLATVAKFGNDHEYLSVVNSCLKLETTTFNYPFELVYDGKNFETITKFITLHHRKLDLEKEIFGA